MAKNKYFQIGSVLLGQNSTEKKKEYYLKLSADLDIRIKDKDGDVIQEISLVSGESLSLETPQDNVKWLVANNHLTEEQGEERLDKIPKFVKFNVKAKVAVGGESPKKATSKKPTAKKVEEDDVF
jgi:hypothetical protein